MNRFIRLEKLERLIKEGAKKKDELAALRNIFINKYDRSAAGLAEQYWNKYIKSRDLDLPVLTEAYLPVPLPPTKEELIGLFRDSGNAEIINELKSAYPEIDFDQFSSEYLKWLHSRYISREKKEVHPIEDSISTLLNFQGFQDKYKNDASFREEVTQAKLGDISSIDDLTIDHMEKVISLRSDLTVQVHGVDIKEKEFLGKFGDWNVWLPHTKETSAKIAGYEPVTYEPKTTWCTARTKGSNLFYNYIGRDDVPSFLFYIIRDNPEYDEDWLSLGCVSQGSKIVPDFSGRSGGLSVNRANEGLREKDYKRILGDHWDSIRSRIEREIEDFKKEDGTYESPARSIILELAKNVSKFKREWYPKSTEEKKDFAEVILDSEPSREVREQIYKFFAEKAPHNFLSNYIYKAREEGFSEVIRSALEIIAEKDPRDFLSNYRDTAREEGFSELIRSSLERAVKNNLRYFFYPYNYYIPLAKEEGFSEVIRSAFESLAEEDPAYFLDHYRNKDKAKAEGLEDLVKSTLESLAEKDPQYFLTNYMEAAKAEGLDHLIKSALERLAEKEPRVFLILYMEQAKEAGLVEVIKSALELAAKQNPENFGYYMAKAKKAGLFEEIKSVFRSIAEKDPSRFEYFNEMARGLGLSIDTESLNGENTTASVENKLLKLSRALKSLGMIKESKFILKLATQTSVPLGESN